MSPPPDNRLFYCSVDTALTMKRVSLGYPNAIISPPATYTIITDPCSTKHRGEKITSLSRTYPLKIHDQYI